VCSTVCKEKSSTSDREEVQLKTFSYHVDENAEDEVADPSLSKPGRCVSNKIFNCTERFVDVVLVACSVKKHLVKLC